MITKELSRKYIWMNGKEVDCFIGRVHSKIKTMVWELSATPKTNEYGEYGIITVKISKTRFNGKHLQIFISEAPDVFGIVRDFIIPLEDIEVLEKQLKGEIN